MFGEWQNIAWFYWRRDGCYEGVPVYVEVSTELADDALAAEIVYMAVVRHKIPEVHRGFKDSCFYTLQVDDRILGIRCFRTRSKDGKVNRAGVRIRLQKNESPA